MEEIAEKNISEKALVIRTNEDVIEYRGSLFNATRKWWKISADRVKQIDYVMVYVRGEGIIREVYMPDKTTWHKEPDSGKDILKFDGERYVFGTKDDSDDSEYCKSMLAPEDIRQKYTGKHLANSLTKNQNPVRYTF